MRILINGYHFGSNTPPYVPFFRSRGHTVMLTTAAAFGVDDLLRRHSLSPLLTVDDLLVPEYARWEARLLRTMRSARLPQWRSMQARRMRILIDAFQPDIVWNHSLWIDSDVMIWTGFHPQVTVPYGYNEVELQPGRKKVRRRIYEETDAFIDAVPGFRRFFTQSEGIPESKFPPETLYLGVPGLRSLLAMPRSQAPNIRTEPGISKNTTLLLETRGLRQKDGGTMSAVRATADLVSRGADVHLVILGGLLGTAQVQHDVARIIDDLRLRDHVTTVSGELSYDTLLAHYASADIFLSLLPSDVLGKSIMEAGAAGCQLVLSDLPDYHLAFGTLAEYVDPSRPAEVASAIARIMAVSPEEKASRSDRIRRWLADHQDFETASDKILAYFQSVISMYRDRITTSRRGV